MTAPVTRDIVSPEAIRREVIAEYWRSRVPTTEIARAMGIDEAEVCRVIDALERPAGGRRIDDVDRKDKGPKGEEGDGNVRKDAAG